MEKLEDKILNLMEKTTLVFQTQAVADSWTTAYAKKYGSAFKDRAISWDEFRDSCTEYPEDCKKADDTDRRMFVELLSSQSIFKKLRYYADFKFPESVEAYKRSIAADLPKLCKSYLKDGSLKKDLIEKAPGDLISDIKILVPEYRKFLEKNKLYERNLCIPDFSKKPGFALVFPGSFKDFEIEEALKYCNSLQPEYSEEIYKNLTNYKNSTAEIRSVMRKVRTILNDGKTRPGDIALTVADLSKYRPYIEYEAHIRDIEPDFTESQKLSDLPPGKFIKKFIKARSENYSFDSMKDLFLNPQFPFKDKADYSWIITSAVKLKVTEGLGTWNDKLKKNKEEQGWPNTEEDNINNRRAFESFEKFSSSVKTFDSTLKPDNLRECFMTLSKTLLTDGQWTVLNNAKNPQGSYAKVFGSCMDELAKLEKKAALYGITDTDKLLGIYTEILDSVSYLENKKVLGLKVYNYPMSAGLNIKHHFVLNLSDSLTKCQRDPYPFLSKDAFKRKELGKEIIGTYLIQGACLSGCEESYSGPSVMPACFVGEGKSSEGELEKDSFYEEELIWETENKTEDKTEDKLQKITMSKVQKEGFDLMSKAGLYYTSECVFPEMQVPMDVRISGIKDFENCPYKTFVQTVLGLEESQYTLKMENAAQIGNILHETIQKALKETKEFNNLKTERLKEIFKEELIEYSNSKDAPPKIFIYRIYKKYENLLGLFTDCSSLRDYELIAMEGETAWSLTLHKMTFKGRADLVLENKAGELAVIDMKKNAKDYFSSTDINKTSLQLILYARLLKANPAFDKVPVYGAYYSFEDGKFKEVWPKLPYEKADLNLEERLCKLEEIIDKSLFNPCYDKKSCDNCGLCIMCRGGYEIK